MDEGNERPPAFIWYAVAFDYALIRSHLKQKVRRAESGFRWRPIWECLKPHVFSTVRVANLGCDVVSLP